MGGNYCSVCMRCHQVCLQCAHARLQVIHADGNESNILVDGQPGAAPCVTGILDFGDFGHNWRVAEPAILLLYVLLLAEHPVAAAVATLVRSLISTSSTYTTTLASLSTPNDVKHVEGQGGFARLCCISRGQHGALHA